MPLDPQYADAIKGFEGYAPQAQWDYKQNSNGYGTKAQYPGEVIDKDTAEQRFQTEIQKAQDHVESVAPNAPPGVKAALTSLTYNAGPGWASSGLGDAVRAGDWNGAAERFQQYNKAGGQVNPGLVARRTKEAAWFGAPLGAPTPPQAAPVTQAQAPVPVSSQTMPGYTPAQNNAPAGILGGAPSPQQPQQAPVMAEMAPPQPMQIDPGLHAPMLGGPRRPPDLTQLKALLARSPQSRAFSFSRIS